MFYSLRNGLLDNMHICFYFTTQRAFYGKLVQSTYILNNK